MGHLAWIRGICKWSYSFFCLCKPLHCLLVKMSSSNTKYKQLESCMLDNSNKCLIMLWILVIQIKVSTMRTEWQCVILLILKTLLLFKFWGKCTKWCFLMVLCNVCFCFVKFLKVKLPLTRASWIVSFCDLLIMQSLSPFLWQHSTQILHKKAGVLFPKR